MPTKESGFVTFWCSFFPSASSFYILWRRSSRHSLLTSTSSLFRVQSFVRVLCFIFIKGWSVNFKLHRRETWNESQYFGSQHSYFTWNKKMGFTLLGLSLSHNSCVLSPPIVSWKGTCSTPFTRKTTTSATRYILWIVSHDPWVCQKWLPYSRTRRSFLLKV